MLGISFLKHVYELFFSLNTTCVQKELLACEQTNRYYVILLSSRQRDNASVLAISCFFPHIIVADIPGTFDMFHTDTIEGCACCCRMAATGFTSKLGIFAESIGTGRV